MWQIRIIQNYFDIDDCWEGQGYPVTLKSKFGDTNAVLSEIREFLKGQGDEKPLTADPEDIDFLWSEAKKDMTNSYEVNLRTDPYEKSSPNDEFDGTVQITLWVSYNVAEAREKQTKRAEKAAASEPQPEQLDMFA